MAGCARLLRRAAGGVGTGELVRTTFQLRLFADVLDEGTFLAATIDLPNPNWPTGARLDLRQTVLPVGPVVSFAASNFPFAHRVAGGDTASALAAECPVVLKTHLGYPKLSRRTGAIVSEALHAAQAPTGRSRSSAATTPNGRPSRTSASVRARSPGRPRQDASCSTWPRAGRPHPRPRRNGQPQPRLRRPAGGRATTGRHRRDGYLPSCTLGTGQFGTKPGLLFVPPRPPHDSSTWRAPWSNTPGPPCSTRIQWGFQDKLTSLAEHPAMRVVTRACPAEDGSTPSLLTTTAELQHHHDQLLTECFGPTSILVSYAEKATLLQHRVGRLVYNGWPTGVSISPAMQPGGP